MLWLLRDSARSLQIRIPTEYSRGRWPGGFGFSLWLWNEFKSDSPWTNTGYSVPEYDALIDAAEAATTEEEQHRILKEANTWHRDKHLMIWGPEVPTYQATQPWLIGYNGEFAIGSLGQFHNVLTRLWIDSELKKEMGH